MNVIPELGELRGELRAAGVFEFREARGWLKLAALAVAHAGCLVALVTLGSWAIAPAVFFGAVTATSIAMCGHEGSHRSFSASPARNALLMYLTFPLFSGLSSLYWREKHDRLHHGHPNVEGRDPDIKPFPFVSSRGDHERAGAGERWFQRNFQRYAFWPMTLLMTLGMRRSSMLYVARYPKKHGFTRTWWIEVACLTGHYTMWVVVPSLVWGPAIGIGLYLAIYAIVGVFLALVFAPAHIGLPILADQNNDWLHQIETTRDLALPRVISFFFIGLDYQVEHHLFPKIPHLHLPRAAKITAAWCARHGLPYQRVPYLAALGDSAQYMADAWTREATDPMEVRLGLVSRAA